MMKEEAQEGRGAPLVRRWRRQRPAAGRGGPAAARFCAPAMMGVRR